MLLGLLLLPILAPVRLGHGIMRHTASFIQ
jgi:hypothetical protein